MVKLVWVHFLESWQIPILMTAEYRLLSFGFASSVQKRVQLIGTFWLKFSNGGLLDRSEAVFKPFLSHYWNEMYINRHKKAVTTALLFFWRDKKVFFSFSLTQGFPQLLSSSRFPWPFYPFPTLKYILKQMQRRREKVQTILALMEENRPFHLLTNSDNAYNLRMNKGKDDFLLYRLP